jgi:hypothetical protein
MKIICLFSCILKKKIIFEALFSISGRFDNLLKLQNYA